MRALFQERCMNRILYEFATTINSSCCTTSSSSLIEPAGIGLLAPPSHVAHGQMNKLADDIINLTILSNNKQATDSSIVL